MVNPGVLIYGGLAFVVFLSAIYFILIGWQRIHGNMIYTFDELIMLYLTHLLKGSEAKNNLAKKYNSPQWIKQMGVWAFIGGVGFLGITLIILLQAISYLQ